MHFEKSCFGFAPNAQQNSHQFGRMLNSTRLLVNEQNLSKVIADCFVASVAVHSTKQLSQMLSRYMGPDFSVATRCISNMPEYLLGYELVCIVQ